MARKTEFQRFVEKIRPPKDPVRDCWEWIGCKIRGGYGQTSTGGRRVLAHRYSFDASHLGPISPGMQLDHLCRNTSCVNPNHLEQVTGRENTSRGLSGILKAGKTSRFVGVSWDKKDEKWRALATVKNKSIHLGHFEKEEDAARAYLSFVEAILAG